jgi:hypothetical protein
MQGLPSSADQCAASSLAPLENFGHLRRIDRQTHRHAMSALAPKADIARRYWHVRLVPGGNIAASRMGMCGGRRAKEGELASDVWWIDASSVARSVRPADGSAGLADGGSGHAAASDHGPTRAATGGYLRDHAVRLRNWGGRHCLRRSCDGEGKASNGNQPEHWFSPLFSRCPASLVSWLSKSSRERTCWQHGEREFSSIYHSPCAYRRRMLRGRQ